MLESVRQDSQGEGLDLGDRLFASLSVNHDAGKSGHLRDPSPVFFLFQLYGQIQGDLVTEGSSMTR